LQVYGGCYPLRLVQGYGIAGAEQHYRTHNAEQDNSGQKMMIIFFGNINMYPMMVQVPAALGKTEVNFCPMITIPKVDMTFTFVSV